MPWSCFSYSADVPTPSRTRKMTGSARFSYPVDMNRMVNTACFSYPADVPSGPRKHDVAEPLLPGLRNMPFGSCFRY
jgi:hypothetical protein